MQLVIRQQRDRRGKILARVLALCLLAGAMVGVTATAASAHYPDIAATVDCQGLVQFTSTSWQSNNATARTNPHIDIAISKDGGAYTALPWKSAWQYSQANGFTFSDSYQLPSPLPQTIKVRAWATAAFGDGASKDSFRETKPISVVGPCAAPKAEIATACSSDNHLQLTLRNGESSATGGVDAKFAVTVGATTTNYTVAYGKSQKVNLDIPENETRHVKVTSGDKTLVDRDVTVDCLKPAPKAVIDNNCQRTEVTLSNTAGKDEVTFTVTGPNPGQSQQVTVAAGKYQDLDFKIPEKATVTITVTAPGMQTVTKTFTQNCLKPAPAATITHDCSGFTVNLDNTAGQDVATFTVTWADGTTQTQQVAAKKSVQLHHGGLVDGKVNTVKVTGDEDFSKTDNFTPDCHHAPTAVVTTDCAGFHANLVNHNDAASGTAVQFTVTGPGSSDSTKVNVPAGATRAVDLPMAENATGTVSVSAAGMETVSKTFTVDCLHPAPVSTINATCSGVTVTLDNSAGADTATFAVAWPDGTSTTHQVAAGAKTVLPAFTALKEGADNRTTVTSEGVTVADNTFHASCTQVLGVKIAAPPAAAPAKAPALAFTGADPAPVLALVGGLFVLGTALLFAGRARRSARD